MAQGMGVGASLVSYGLGQKAEAMQGLRTAADEEAKRNAENTRLAAQDRAGKQQLGSTLGSTAGFMLGAQEGSIGGPWGALIGGALGAVASGLFSR